MTLRLILPVAAALLLSACQPPARSTTLTVSGPSDVVADFLATQTGRHPDLVVERTSEGLDRSRVVLTAPDSITGDEVTRIGRDAIAMRLTTKVGG